VKTQFIAFQRAVQGVFQLQNAPAFCRKKAEIVAAIALGAVHRDIGALGQRI
jgi:hypothetical protein